MKKHEKRKVANDTDSGQPPALMALAGYGNHRNYLDSDIDSGHVNSTNEDNHEMSDKAPLQ